MSTMNSNSSANPNWSNSSIATGFLANLRLWGLNMSRLCILCGYRGSSNGWFNKTLRSSRSWSMVLIKVAVIIAIVAVILRVGEVGVCISSVMMNLFTIWIVLGKVGVVLGSLIMGCLGASTYCMSCVLIFILFGFYLGFNGLFDCNISSIIWLTTSEGSLGSIRWCVRWSTGGRVIIINLIYCTIICQRYCLYLWCLIMLILTIIGMVLSLFGCFNFGNENQFTWIIVLIIRIIFFLIIFLVALFNRSILLLIWNFFKVFIFSVVFTGKWLIFVSLRFEIFLFEIIRISFLIWRGRLLSFVLIISWIILILSEIALRFSLILIAIISILISILISIIIFLRLMVSLIISWLLTRIVRFLKIVLISVVPCIFSSTGFSILIMRIIVLS